MSPAELLRQAHRRAVSLRSARDPELRRAIVQRVLFELRAGTAAAAAAAASAQRVAAQRAAETRQ